VHDPAESPALPDGVTLREAEGRDILAMVDVVNDAFHEESFFVDRPRTHPLLIAEQLGLGHFLLAHLGRKLVALVFYELRGERGYIGMLAVRPGHQRAGLGRAMIRAAERNLRTAGCSVAEVAVVNLRTELPQFYHKLGYVEAGVEEPHDELRQKFAMRLIKMEKPL
jgi:ribosomal protein S18 acetylase RimI-like enzyme